MTKPNESDVDLALLRVRELAMALEAVGHGDEPDGDVVVALAEVIQDKVFYAQELLAKERGAREGSHG